MPCSTNKPQDLNDAQWRAVMHEGGHLLIVAGPGTGKTHTLTYRIARIAQDLPRAQRILAVTFTNKAAKEMRERLSTRLSVDNHDLIVVGTFHHFCLRLLRGNNGNVNAGLYRISSDILYAFPLLMHTNKSPNSFQIVSMVLAIRTYSFRLRFSARSFGLIFKSSSSATNFSLPMIVAREFLMVLRRC